MFDRVVTQEEIAAAVEDLAKRFLMNRDHWPGYAMVVVMDGAFMFAADLARALHFTGDVIFVSSKSYGSKRSAQRPPMVATTWSGPMPDRVLVVDTLVETGGTLQAVMAHCIKAGALDVCTCALVRKRSSPGRADLIGLEVPDVWVVGYGLDDAGMRRGVPDIYAKEE